MPAKTLGTNLGIETLLQIMRLMEGIKKSNVPRERKEDISIPRYKPKPKVEPPIYPNRPGEGGSEGQRDDVGPNVAGEMTESEKEQAEAGIFGSAFGDIGGKVASGAVSAATGMLGMGVSPTSFADWGSYAASKIDSGLKALGLSSGRHTVSQTAAEQQGMADRYGYGMHGAPSGIVGGVSVGPSGYGSTPSEFGTFAEAPAPSVSNPDAMGGAGSPGASDTAGTADSTGGSKGTEGSDVRAQGGVYTTERPRTQRITWGEKGTGGETAIYMPHRYFQSGVQNPKEQQIRMALLANLLRLLQ